jgi:hypothetical protein
MVAQWRDDQPIMSIPRLESSIKWLKNHYNLSTYYLCSKVASDINMFLGFLLHNLLFLYF